MPETNIGPEHFESINISETSVQKVDAELVRMNRSAARHIQAEEVEVRQGGVMRVDATSLSVQQGGVSIARASNLKMDNSALLIGRAGEAVVESSRVGALYSPSVEMKYSHANLLVARQVSGGPVRAIVMLAGKVEGPVRAYLDTPRALLAGLAAGLGFGIVLLLGRQITRR
jgi:hypothetical protein